MVIQPAQQMGLDGEDKSIFAPVEKSEDEDNDMQGYFSYPLVMQCVMMDGKIELHLTYDASILKEEQLQAMAHQYEATVLSLIQHSDRFIQDIEMACWRWVGFDISFGASHEIVGQTFERAVCSQ